MRDGVVGAVFDYALGEIADEVFGGLRAAGPERLTVAGELGLPQVICPGGAEHLGLFVEANSVPAEYADHAHVFHSPVIFVPRTRKPLSSLNTTGRRLRNLSYPSPPSMSIDILRFTAPDTTAAVSSPPPSSTTTELTSWIS